MCTTLFAINHSARAGIRYVLSCWFFVLAAMATGQEKTPYTTSLAGVYQGETLFIQNSYNLQKKSFCIEEVQINGQRLSLNYGFSALKIDFKGFDLYTPVKVDVIQKDSLCKSAILNPDAILFHTIFRFSDIQLSDTLLSWHTKGEVEKGTFEVEALEGGVWRLKETVDATGVYEGAVYNYYPSMKEGANKYRVKYNFPVLSRVGYIYSQEKELEYYPEAVDFNPKSAKTHLYLSRASSYEIYDQGNNLVLQGEGKEVDLKTLQKGRYVIYFGGRFPGGFNKE